MIIIFQCRFRIKDMTRRLFTAFLMLALTATMLAIPARRGMWQNITLADSTTVKVELRGDENGHFWSSADGTVYLKDVSGAFFTQATDAQLTALNARREQKSRAAAMRRQRRRQSAMASQGQFTGTKKGLIILVEFIDQTFSASNDKKLYERIANEEGFTDAAKGFKGSVSDYFKAQSGGVFALDFDVAGPVKMSKSYAYYGANDSYGNDKHAGEMVATACQLVDESVNFADYDWDGDGMVEQVYVVYAGKGEANGGAASTIWPHEWELYSSDYGKYLKLDGVNINVYACGCELGYTGAIDGIGTMCHEFSHCMGLPDMYDTSGGSGYGMFNWSIMDYGSYNEDGFLPAGYTSYEKMYCGWLQPEEITADTTISALRPLSEGGGAYIIYNDGNRNEYFLLENRQLIGWDAGLFGRGMLAIHVDYNESKWYYNEVNADASHQRCTIIPADRSYAMNYANDIAGDAFPYNNYNSIADGVPYTALYNSNTDGTKLMHKSVTGITQNADGTVSFEFKSAGKPDDSTTGESLFYESFDLCSGTGGNDGKWLGSIASATFVPDNEGWQSEKKYGASQCARFGTSSVSGNVTSPSFYIDGETTLTFRAAPWGLLPGELNLSVTGNATLSQSVLSLPASTFTDYSITLSGSGYVSLTFFSDGRFFLDEICVKKNESLGINDVQLGESRKNINKGIYSIDGRYLGQDRRLLSPGLYVIDGRKVVVR